MLILRNSDLCIDFFTKSLWPKTEGEDHKHQEFTKIGTICYLSHSREKKRKETPQSKVLETVFVIIATFKSKFCLSK